MTATVCQDSNYNAEHTEKDRIVKNTVYKVELEIVLQNNADTDVLIARYGKVFEKLVAEYATVGDVWERPEIQGFEGNCSQLMVKSAQ